MTPKAVKTHISIVLAEESFIIRRGFHAFFKKFDQVKVVAEATQLHELVQQSNRLKPDFVVLSADFVQKYIERQLPDYFIARLQTRYIVFHRPGQHPGFAETADYLLNINEATDELFTFFDELFDKIPLKRNTRNSSELSTREKTILKGIAKGNTTREIAEKLHISPLTVETHRKNISKKLGIRSVSGLTIYAVVNNLIDLDDSIA